MNKKSYFSIARNTVNCDDVLYHSCEHMSKEYRNGSSYVQRRWMGKYRHSHKDGLNEPTKEQMLREEYEKDSPPPKISDLKTADDMDFYDPLTEDSEAPGFDENYYYPKSSGTPKDSDYMNNEVSTGLSTNVYGEDNLERLETEAARQKAVRDELDSRTGRLWTDPYEISDDDWGSMKTLDDLPDWSPEICSRVSLERVKLFQGGVPTLDELAQMSLPASSPSHPALGDPKPYLKERKKTYEKLVYDEVSKIADKKIGKILSLNDFNDKQDAIDDLFEFVHEKLSSKKPEANSRSSGKAGALHNPKAEKHNDKLDVWASQHDFGQTVEKALEKYLRNVNKNEKEKSTKSEVTDDSSENSDDYKDHSEPIFMDILKGKGCTLDENGIPSLIHPLKPHPKDGPGRMIEEWELAANQKTKRIMCRSCMKEIAEILSNSTNNNAAGYRILVKGERGVGKTTTLAAIVSSARVSGHIVLYLPDGDRLRKLGFYNEPNKHREGFFDLPVLTQEVCGDLLHSHISDLEGLVASQETLQTFLSHDHHLKLAKELNISEKKEDDNDHESASLSDIPLATLLDIGNKSKSLSAACYGAVVHTLMNQTTKPFTIVADSFNCYYDHGHYFHQKYDPKAKKPIPLHKITLFQPILDAIGIEKRDDGSFVTKTPIPFYHGGIVAGLTESHAVKREFTSNLIEKALSSDVKVVHVPQFSPVEVDHVIANFELIGIGRLRFDRGEIAMNEEEVAFLRMVSGGVGQQLLDSCIG